MNAPVVPDCIPRSRGKFSAWLGKSILRLLGWKITGEIPAQRKMILAVAPHTSNWDFILGVAAMLMLNLKVKFMGKDAIFVWPIKGLLIKLGGIAIDRSSRHGIVGQMVQEFKQQDQMILGLAPEGTRSKITEWKTGFLHIAHQADVPVVPVSLDYSRKEICFHSASIISDDIPSELQRIKAVYRGACAKNPQAV